MNDEQQPLQTETVNTQLTDQQPIMSNQNASNSKRKIIAITAAIIVLVAVAVAGWLVLGKDSPQQSDQQVASPTAQKEELSSLQPEEVITKVKDTFAAEYKLIDLDQSNQPKAGELSIRSSESSPVYKTEGYNFYTDYDGGSSMDMMPGPVNWATDSVPRQSDTALRKKVISIYEGFGMKKTSYPDKGDELYDRYTGRGLICQIEAPDAETSSNTAVCGSIEAYKAAAEKAKPFAESLPDADSSTVIVNIIIEASSVAGYQNAMVGIGGIDSPGGAIAVFYKKDSGAWTYFTSTQDTIECSAFNTLDLRSAFKGYDCFYGNDGELKKVE